MNYRNQVSKVSFYLTGPSGFFYLESGDRNMSSRVDAKRRERGEVGGFPNKETKGGKDFYEILFHCNFYST